MKNRAWIIGGLAATALGATPRPATAATAPPSPLRTATITRVEDGRTVWLGAAGPPPFKARLAWVAVPAPLAGNSKGEPHGDEARQRLEVWKDRPVEFLTVGREPDGVPLVELLWRPTAESVVTLNYEMVRSGFARADCSTSGEYGLQCRVLRRAEDVARKERRGIWAAQ